MPSMPPNVASVLLSQLAMWGVKHIYGLAGDAIIPLLDAIRQQNALRYIAVRHETSAAFMASAEGKCASRLAVCIGTSGPGLANMMNGIADAAADHVPILVITGQVESDKVGTEAKQYIDQEQLISPLAVYTASLLHPDAVLAVLNKAVIEALSKRGAAHISIPKDVLALPCPLAARPPTGLLNQTVPKNSSQLDSCVAALNSAQRPLIYIGHGARHAAGPILKLAEALSAGIIETLGAKGTVPANHHLHIGGIGEGGTKESADLLKQADCLLVVGANWYPDDFVPREIQVIKIDTAPGSIEAQQDITLGLVGDAAEVIDQLLPKLSRPDRTDWLGAIRSTREAIALKLDLERRPSGQAITPQALMAALEKSVAPDAIIALDTGDHTIWFNRMFQAQQQTILFSGKWRTMGFGLPAAISAKLQYPDKQVTALAGDGSFLMTAMELSTLVRYQTPVKIIVANNGTLAAEKSKMTAAGLQPYGVDLTNPDFSMLAKSFGMKSLRVEAADELDNALSELYADDQPMLLEVRITDPSPIAEFSS